MKNYSELLTEKNVSEAEMMEQIASAFKKHFPNGWINVLKKAILSEVIVVNLGLISDRNAQSSKIMENDPMYHSFMMHIEEPEMKYEVEVLQGRLSINPTNPHMAMSSVKTKWRKTTGSPDKVLKAFLRFFTNLRKLVNEHESNIYQRNKYDDKWFK